MIFQFDRVAVAALNHLLAGESWATERLRPFAGQPLRLEGGPLAWSLVVDASGEFRVSAAAADPVVTITLPADAPWRLLTDRQSVFAAVRLAGAADFVETLGFVFRNLRWDAEGDLAAVVGDIPAHRIARTARQMLAWQGATRRNLAANLVEYATEDGELLVPLRERQAFGQAVAALSADVNRLEQRLQRLAGRR